MPKQETHNNESRIDDIIWLQLWRQNDWGQYMRRNEVFTHELAKDPQTAKVVHVEEVTVKAFFKWLLLLFTSNQKRNALLHVAKAISPFPVKVKSKIRVTSLLTLGGNRYFLFRYINTALLWLQFKIKLPRHKKPVALIAYPPSLSSITGANVLRPDCLIVDLIDDVIARTPDEAMRAFYLQNYSRVLPKADKIIATGESLRSYENLANMPIETVPNGVDLSPYVTLQNAKALDIASEAHVPKVGYVGSINSAMNEDLILACLEELPEVNFQFYGFIASGGQSKIDRCDEHENFSFNGILHYGNVPKFLQSCDVLVMPKYHNQMTRGNDSMKVYQYLATGNPIVSTSVPPAPQFAAIVEIADSPRLFVDALKRALADEDREKRRLRIEMAEQNDWSEKVQTLVAYAQETLDDQRYCYR